MLRPNAGYGLLILEVFRSHTTTQHSRWDSSGRVISSSQRPLPDNTQLTRDRHTCPHSHSRRRGWPVPYTARPLGPTYGEVTTTKLISEFHLISGNSLSFGACLISCFVPLHSSAIIIAHSILIMFATDTYSNCIRKNKSVLAKCDVIWMLAIIREVDSEVIRRIKMKREFRSL